MKIDNLIEKWTKDPKGHLSKEYTLKANKHMKRCSPSYIIKEIQVKTTIRYH